MKILFWPASLLLLKGFLEGFSKYMLQDIGFSVILDFQTKIYTKILLSKITDRLYNQVTLTLIHDIEIIRKVTSKQIF